MRHGSRWLVHEKQPVPRGWPLRDASPAVEPVTCTCPAHRSPPGTRLPSAMPCRHWPAGWRQPLSIGGVVGRWREVVGDQIADHCVPETFEDGVLVVRTDSTAWATQIRLLTPQLDRRLAEEVGEGVVTSIKVLGPGGPSWSRGTRRVQGGRGPRDTYG